MALLDFARSQADDKDTWTYMALVVDQPEWLQRDDHSKQEQDALLKSYEELVKSNEYLTNLYESFKEPLEDQDIFDDDPYNTNPIDSETQPLTGARFGNSTSALYALKQQLQKLQAHQDFDAESKPLLYAQRLVVGFESD